MIKRCPIIVVVLVLLCFTCCPHAKAQTANNLISQLKATCTTPGAYASASLVSVNKHTALALRGTGENTSAEGDVNFSNAIFQYVIVEYFGECFANFDPASFQLRVLFLPPGTQTVLNHGYNCLTNTHTVAPDGAKRMTITTQSICDCGDHIPVGSKLIGLELMLNVNDGSGDPHSFLITQLNVNGHLIGVDPHIQDAYCESSSEP